MCADSLWSLGVCGFVLFALVFDYFDLLGGYGCGSGVCVLMLRLGWFLWVYCFGELCFRVPLFRVL